MRTDPISLAGGAYADESRPYSMQDTLNMRAQRTEAGGTRSPDKLQTLPGLRPYVEVGTDPVRGAHNAEGRLLQVMGDTLYRISGDAVAVPIGTIPGTGRVQLDHNQISLGNEVMAVNGSAGYLWNTVTNAFGRITDPGFPGGSVVKFISGYFVVIEPQGRFAQNSAPAQGLEWNTLDRFTSEVSPDRLMSMGVRGSELLLLSASSGEFFQATANAQQPFRTKRIDFKVGAAGSYGTIDADNNIWWLGSDGVFYCLNGYSQFRISTRPIEDAIQGLDWSRAFAFRWDTVIYWTFPDGLTFGYDYAEKEWHRRASYGLNRWRVNTMTWWNKRWIAGDFQAGRLWDCNLSDRYYLEGDTPYIRRRTLGVSHDNQNPMRTSLLELVMDTGQAETVPVPFPSQPEAPTITGPAPDAVVGAAYSHAYTLADGTPPYVVSVAAGTLPAGLTLSTAGVLSGTPTEVGESEFTPRVTDANGLWDELPEVLEVEEALVGAVMVHGARAYEGAIGALAVIAGSTTVSDLGTQGCPTKLSDDGLYLIGNDAFAGLTPFAWDPDIEDFVAMSVVGSEGAAGGQLVGITLDAGYVAAVSADYSQIVIWKRDEAGTEYTSVETVTPSGFLTGPVCFSRDGTKVCAGWYSASASGGFIVYDFDSSTDTLTLDSSLEIAGDSFIEINFGPSNDIIYGTKMSIGTDVYEYIGAAWVHSGRSNSVGLGSTNYSRMSPDGAFIYESELPVNDIRTRSYVANSGTPASAFTLVNTYALVGPGGPISLSDDGSALVVTSGSDAVTFEVAGGVLTETQTLNSEAAADYAATLHGGR